MLFQVGKGHQEFSTGRQQDAQEFFLHLCSLIEKSHVSEGKSPIDCLQFEVEDRIECGASGKVKYTSRTEDFVPFPVPVEAATNKEAVAEFEKRKEEVGRTPGQKIPDEEVVRPNIPFSSCLEAFMDEEVVPDYYSSAIKGKTVAKKRCRLRTFPDYLVVQLKKFDLGEDWKPVKLDVEVLMPDELDLSKLKGSGKQEGEEELPEEEAQQQQQQQQLEPDAAIVEQLNQMGFDINGCKRAAVNTKNAGVEAAMNWILEHSEDADFAAPFQQQQQPAAAAGGGGGGGFQPDPNHLANLIGMGLPEAKCKKALKETSNNLERAVDWIFSHPDDDGTEDAAPPQQQQGQGRQQSQKLTDGDPVYELAGFISHIGTSVHVGHYVCHLLKADGQWVIFNDSKARTVVLSCNNIGTFSLPFIDMSEKKNK